MLIWVRDLSWFLAQAHPAGPPVFQVGEQVSEGGERETCLPRTLRGASFESGQDVQR